MSEHGHRSEPFGLPQLASGCGAESNNRAAKLRKGDVLDARDVTIASLTLPGYPNARHEVLYHARMHKDVLMPNSAAPWHDFDSRYYFSLNYSRMRDDDSQIVEIIRDFFDSATLPAGAQGVDVGTGTNLYPALALLPLCEEKLTLWEYAPPNVEWLRKQWPSYSRSWDEFWQLLQKRPRYAAVTDPREMFRSRVDIRHGSVFELPREEWDIGTMFFVAESLSTQVAEFRSATESFLRALRPGSPFAAAFMENSAGYDVGGTFFPAVSVSATDLRETMAGLTEKIDIDRIDIDGKPLREGYSGMLLVRGTTKERERRR